jgi:hypothetical protein
MAASSEKPKSPYGDPPKTSVKGKQTGRKIVATYPQTQVLKRQPGLKKKSQ